MKLKEPLNKSFVERVAGSLRQAIVIALVLALPGMSSAQVKDVGKVTELPPVVVTFEIFKDGSVKNIKVIKSSGNFALDQSAQRAILASVPLPKLPAEYEHNSANLEFWFRLQK